MTTDTTSRPASAGHFYVVQLLFLVMLQLNYLSIVI